MPGITQKSSLLAKFGDRFIKAADAHADDPVDLGGFSELPAGITGGIAKLDVVRIQPIAEGKTNAGEPLFYAAGIVKSPKDHNGQRVEGLRTSFTVNLFDKTPGDGGFEKGVAKVQMHLKALGASADQVRGANLEDTIRRFNEAAKSVTKPIHFKFRTWKGSKQVFKQGTDGKWRVHDEYDDGTSKPSTKNVGSWPTEAAAKAAVVNKYVGREPMVNHQWGEKCDFTAPAAGDGVRDGTAAPGANGTGHAAGTSFSEFDAPPAADDEPPADVPDSEPAADDAAAGDAEPAADEGADADPEANPETDWAASDDLDALVAAAEAEVQPAFDRLMELAAAVGVEAEARAAGSWPESHQIIKDAQDAAAAAEEAPAEESEPAPPPPAPKPKTPAKPAAAPAAAEFTPKVKWTYRYQRRDAKGQIPMDPRTKKPAKPIEVMTTAVDPKTKTVTAVDLTTKKPLLAADGKTPLRIKFADLIRD